MAEHSSPEARRLPAGAAVEVRDHFDLSFCSGFEVAAATDGGYRVRRRSDGVELPAVFPDGDVRADPRRA